MSYNFLCPKHSWLTEAVTAPSGSPPVPLCVSDLRSFDFTTLSAPAPTCCGQNTRVRACFMNISPDTNTSRFRGNFQEYSSGKVNSLAQKHFLLTRELKQLLQRMKVVSIKNVCSGHPVRLVSAACPLPEGRKEFAKYFVGIMSACVHWPRRGDILTTRQGLVSIQHTSYLIITQVGEPETWL